MFPGPQLNIMPVSRRVWGPVFFLLWGGLSPVLAQEVWPTPDPKSFKTRIVTRYSCSKFARYSDDSLECLERRNRDVLIVGVFIIMTFLIIRGVQIGMKMERLPTRKDAEAGVQVESRLAEIGLRDSKMRAQLLKEAARDLFLKLEQCRVSRDLGPVRDRIIPYLARNLVLRWESLKRSGEVQKRFDLVIDSVSIVHFIHSPSEPHIEFTAFIRGSAMTQFLRQETGRFIDGDVVRRPVEECWTFQWMEGKWILREIEQARDSAKLCQDSWEEGLEGGWVGVLHRIRSNKISEALSQLGSMNPIWQEKKMLHFSRNMALAYFSSVEKGSGEWLEADATLELLAQIKSDHRLFGGLEGTLHFRNLGCCDVSILQVDPKGSGYTAEVLLHAQRVISRGNRVISSDEELKSLTVKLDFLAQSRRFLLTRVRYLA